MSINLLERVQQNIGYPSLQKMDPNSQKIILDDKTLDEDKFSQAAIPTILIGLYRYVQSDEGAISLLHENDSFNWVSEIFSDNKGEVVKSVADYSALPYEIVLSNMNLIAEESIKVIKENLPVDTTIKQVKVFLNDQKNDILMYLPAALNIGVLLNNDTLDDNTNKMEGPISSLMQTIGSAFSTPVVKDEIKSQ